MCSEDFSQFWGLRFQPLPWFVSGSVIRAFESVPVSRSFRRASSFSRLDFTLAKDKFFPSGPAWPSVTTSVSQLSGRDLSNNNASTSSANTWTPKMSTRIEDADMVWRTNIKHQTQSTEHRTPNTKHEHTSHPKTRKTNHQRRRTVRKDEDENDKKIALSTARKTKSQITLFSPTLIGRETPHLHCIYIFGPPSHFPHATHSFSYFSSHAFTPSLIPFLPGLATFDTPHHDTRDQHSIQSWNHKVEHDASLVNMHMLIRLGYVDGISWERKRVWMLICYSYYLHQAYSPHNNTSLGAQSKFGSQHFVWTLLLHRIGEPATSNDSIKFPNMDMYRY